MPTNEELLDEYLIVASGFFPGRGEQRDARAAVLARMVDPRFVSGVPAEPVRKYLAAIDKAMALSNTVHAADGEPEDDPVKAAHEINVARAALEIALSRVNAL